MLAPALALVPVLAVLPFQVHGGGLNLWGRFALAAITPSLEPGVLRHALGGLAISVGIALLGWITSLLLGLVLAIASSRLVWGTWGGTPWPATALRRLLAVPRAIHELLWGLLLLQLVGLKPVVAVVAIAIPFGALVARVLSDQLDALDPRGVEALRCAGAPAPTALLTALGPALLPVLLSYGGYRLECALRSATLLGVFGLGGIGTDLRLSMQSLQFRELWTALWLLFGVMAALEQGLGLLRRRWSMRGRLALRGDGVPPPGMDVLIAVVLTTGLGIGAGWGLGVDPMDLLHWQPLTAMATPDWGSVMRLPWPRLVGGTLALTALAAGLAVGLPPLLLLAVAPRPSLLPLLRLTWALGRLWPPPLTAMLLLFVLRPGVVTAALALGWHTMGILGRLLLESIEDGGRAVEKGLVSAGSGPRLALLYGTFSDVARPYLAYGAYRSDVLLRETVVVGLVGATGLGTQLLEALSAFAWDQLLALVGAYVLLTLLGEALSDHLRRRLLPAAIG
jgi:phosphonate transport system permease protein